MYVFFRVKVYERVGISRVEVLEWLGENRDLKGPFKKSQTMHATFIRHSSEYFNGLL